MKKQKLTVNEKITQNFIDQLERGQIPWKRNWKKGNVAPFNISSGRQYKTVNFLYLMSLNYEDPRFATYNGWKKLGRQVNRGQSGHIVEKWFPVLIDANGKVTKDIKKSVRSFLTQSYDVVFNIAQTSGDDIKPLTKPKSYDHDINKTCEEIINNFPAPQPSFQHHDNTPCYIPKLDSVRMPYKKQFKTAEDYYSTRFHEIVHATGSENRLNREGITTARDDVKYSYEELIAEIGAAFLSSEAGINNEALTENSVAYINGWISRLKNDPDMIVKASKEAQKASDFITNKTPKKYPKIENKKATA